MGRAALFCLCLVPTLASADEVLLRGGGKVSGVIVERTATSVAVEVGPGLVTLPLSRVLSIQEGPSALATYRERASHLAAGDVAGWLALGRWARHQELSTQSREAFMHALAADPASGDANEALGRVLLGDRWVSAEEGYRARGLVYFNGRWVTPAEEEAMLREAEAEEAASRIRQEDDARAREAEARAREAEARAQAAEAEAAYGGMGLGYGAVGIPYLPYGGFVPVSPFLFRHHVVRARPIRMDIARHSIESPHVIRSAAGASSPRPRPERGFR